MAGEYLDRKLICFEVASGAKLIVSGAMTQKVAATSSISLIVGGGIRSKQQIENAYKVGADLVVVGTAFEDYLDFFNNFELNLKP